MATTNPTAAGRQLDGWDIKAQHNIFNALTWGPDGWLYGCNGILSNSRVGKPGTPDKERVDINCGVWRYHPTARTFEVVAHGTTNPWGLDFDELRRDVHHQLRHPSPLPRRSRRPVPADVRPGLQPAHLRADAELLPTTSTGPGGHWTDVRSGAGSTRTTARPAAATPMSAAMIYLGDNWPDEYRNSVFTCNIHGHRINHDVPRTRRLRLCRAPRPRTSCSRRPLVPRLSLKYGPDGGVYVIDWSDTGECHNYDEADHDERPDLPDHVRQPASTKRSTCRSCGDPELVRLQLHKNDWFVRTARRILQERCGVGQGSRPVEHPAERNAWRAIEPVTQRLRAMWALHAIGKLDVSQLYKWMEDRQEHVRAWAVRFQREQNKVEWPGWPALVGRATEDSSPVVRLELAAGLQRMPLEQCWTLARSLLAHADDAEDRTIPLMLWYGIEPLAAADHSRASS